MYIKGVLREVSNETFTKKDKTTGSRTVLFIEVAQPLEIMRIELGNDHAPHEARYKSLVGKPIATPVQHVGRTWEGRTTYNWQTTGNGAPLLDAATPSTQAA